MSSISLETKIVNDAIYFEILELKSPHIHMSENTFKKIIEPYKNLMIDDKNSYGNQLSGFVVEFDNRLEDEEYYLD